MEKGIKGFLREKKKCDDRNGSATAKEGIYFF